LTNQQPANQPATASRAIGNNQWHRKLLVNKQCQEALQQHSHLSLIKKQEALDGQLKPTACAMVCHDDSS